MTYTTHQIMERANILGIKLTLSPDGETIHIKIPKQCKVDTRKMITIIKDHKNELLPSLRQAASAQEVIPPEQCIRCQSSDIYDYVPLSATQAVAYCEKCTPGADPQAHLLAHIDLLRNQSPLRDATIQIYHASEIEALKKHLQASTSLETGTHENYWQSVSNRLGIPPRYHQPVTENGKRTQRSNGNTIFELGKPMMSQQEWTALRLQHQTERPDEARFSHYKGGYRGYRQMSQDTLTKQPFLPDEQLIENYG